MDDNERENYEDYNTVSICCPRCEEIVSSDDWDDQAEICVFCKEQENE